MDYLSGNVKFHATIYLHVANPFYFYCMSIIFKNQSKIFRIETGKTRLRGMKPLRNLIFSLTSLTGFNPVIIDNTDVYTG